MMEANQWGVSSVRAPEVWEMGFLGEGVIVATIDSGVRGTHEALKSNHRKENGWFDPLDGDEVPTDYNGHGTHTMGTIAGQKYGIGVAPLSKWIACKGCDLVCRHSDLIACGNFMGCPTDTSGKNAKCHLAPHLVSNSKGGSAGGTFYDEIVSTWILVDIYPIFAAGNSGNNGCETVTYPGDHTDVITVGAIDKYHNRSEFSSLGPSVRDSGIKPDVSAPGSEIISSFNGSDDDYQQLQGTSMACPHVAGVAALLFSKIPYLPYPDAKKAIIKGAQPTLTSNDTCGGIPEHVYPNNHVGAGRVDAVKSINII